MAARELDARAFELFLGPAPYDEQAEPLEGELIGLQDSEDDEEEELDEEVSVSVSVQQQGQGPGEKAAGEGPISPRSPLFWGPRGAPCPVLPHMDPFFHRPALGGGCVGENGASKPILKKGTYS